MVLVTGSSGYIGRLLSKRLLEKGKSVKGLDISAGMQPISELLDKGLEMYKGSILDNNLLKSVFQDVDTVYHLVGIHSASKEKIYRTYYQGTMKLLKECVLKGVKNFVLISNGAVYGDCGDREIRECDPVRPTHYFGTVTYEMENLVQEYFKLYGVKTYILRVSEVYGIGRESFLRRRALRVPGGPGIYNSRIYIEDLIFILEKCVEKLMPGQIYNVCDDRAVTQLTFYNEIEKITGYDLPEWVSINQFEERIRLSMLGLRAISLRMSNKKIKGILEHKFIISDIIEGLQKMYR